MISKNNVAHFVSHLYIGREEEKLKMMTREKTILGEIMVKIFKTAFSRLIKKIFAEKYFDSEVYYQIESKKDHEIRAQERLRQINGYYF